jgi:hypothetical protein
MPTTVSSRSGCTRFATRAPKRRRHDAADQQPDSGDGEGFETKAKMKVAEMVTVRKNSAVLTVPITFRGLPP